MLQLNRLELAGALGEASLTGGVDLAGQSMDIAMALFPGTPDRFARLTDGVSWSALRLSASLKGGFLEPTLNLSMEAGALAHRDMALESLATNAEVIAAGPLTDPGSRIEIATHFLVEGMDPGPGVPSGFLASEMRIDAQGAIDKAGLVVVDSLKIDAPVARISAQGNGEGWGKKSATFAVTLNLPELSRLAPLADRPLDGAGSLELSADWDGAGAAIRASAELEPLSTGIAVADTLLGHAPQLALEASLGVDGAVAIKSLELAGSGLLMWLSGDIAADMRYARTSSQCRGPCQIRMIRS